MRVAIIGGGVAGLVTSKTLKQDGFDVTVFEKETEIGGVWASSRAYPGLRTNNPAPTYAFSDLDYPETSDEFPTAAQVREYLDRYTEHFDLRANLRLGTEVVSVSHQTDLCDSHHGGYRIETREVATGGETTVRHFDFVVVCNGVLCEPHVPDFEGQESFAGPILHSSEAPESRYLSGKRVLVVGAGKSALDCATFAGDVADACTLVFRRPYWMLPRYFGRTRIDRQAFNRFTELVTFPPFHTMSQTEQILRWIGTPLLPLRWLFRKTQCRMIVRESGIPDSMVPDAPLHRYIYHQGIGAEFYEALRQGRVNTRRAVIERFEGANEVRLNTGEVIPADVVICATGWRQNIGFLSTELQRKVCPESRFRLYRHILPPTERSLGFIGYASSGNSPLTSEVAAHWLSQCFRGELSLPDPEAMERSIDRVLAWTESMFPQQSKGHFIGAHVGHYIDWLMHDMGLETKRAGSLVTELFGPFWAERYRGLARERERLRTS